MLKRAVWRVLSVGLLVAVASACHPMAYDPDTKVLSGGKPEWRVRPIEMSRGPGIEIRFRHCSEVQLLFDDPTVPVEYRNRHLTPRARVVDGTGKVFFDTTGFRGGWVEPPGSRTVDVSSADDDLQRIVVPVAGAKKGLTIVGQCTDYPGAGIYLGYSFTFAPNCWTMTRSCPSRSGGTAHYQGFVSP